MQTKGIKNVQRWHQFNLESGKQWPQTNHHTTILNNCFGFFQGAFNALPWHYFCEQTSIWHGQVQTCHGKKIGGMKWFLEYTSFWIQWGFWNDLIARSHIFHAILRNGLQSFIHKRTRHIESWRWWIYGISWHGGLNSIKCFWKRRCGCHLGWEKRLQASFPNLKPKHFMDSKHNKSATFVKWG